MKNRLPSISRLRGAGRIVAPFALACLAMTPMALSSGCKGPDFGGVMNMSKSQEVQLGQESSQEIEKQSKLVNSGPQYERLQRVAARILPLARHDYDVPFSVKLIDSKEINAFALPGGPIYFYSGLMDLASSDDEIASVLGHEATHVVKRHAVKQISDAQTKGMIAGLVLGKAGNLAKTAASIALQVDQLRFSRTDEEQADTGGFKYLTEAGYDPYAMANFFKKMGAKTGNGGTEWLSNHPLTSKRVQVAEQRAADYKKRNGVAAR